MGEQKKVIYLAGPITGVDRYWEAFEQAESILTKAGFIVLNPATLPAGLSNEKAMQIDISMINVADAVFFLPGWYESKGAFMEWQYCRYIKKLIFEDLGKLLGALK